MSPALINIHAGPGNSIEVFLQPNVSDYCEWIPGEGADIGLYRDQETNRVVGVRLPFYAKSACIWHSGLESLTLHDEDKLVPDMIDGLNEYADQLKEANDQVCLLCRQADCDGYCDCPS
jgi:hypothetical protein